MSTNMLYSRCWSQPMLDPAWMLHPQFPFEKENVKLKTCLCISLRYYIYLLCQHVIFYSPCMFHWSKIVWQTMLQNNMKRKWINSVNIFITERVLMIYVHKVQVSAIIEKRYILHINCTCSVTHKVTDSSFMCCNYSTVTHCAIYTSQTVISSTHLSLVILSLLYTPLLNCCIHIHTNQFFGLVCLKQSIPEEYHHQ